MKDLSGNSKKEDINETLSNEFKDNVSKGDVDIVRSALLDDLIIYRHDYKKFDIELNYAKSKLPNIIEDFDEKEGSIENNPDKWDKQYLNLQKVHLMVNFSDKRIQHLKNVINKVL